MRKFLLQVLGVAVGSMLLVGAAAAQDLKRTNVKIIGSFLNSPNWFSVLHPFWKSGGIAEKLSNGQVTADATSMTELGIKGFQVFRLAKVGVADIVVASTGYAGGELPENDGIDISGLVQSTDEMRKVIDAYWPVIEDKYVSRTGVHPIVMWPTGGQVIWCAVPINGINDLKGKKMRVFSKTMAEFAEAVGAVAVTISFSEVIPALQRKVADCAVTGSMSGNLAKWTEVTTHMYPMILGWSVNMQVANKRFWDGLDPKVRDFIADNSKNEMASLGWRQSKEATDHGVWCTVGDDRCDPTTTKPKIMTKTNLTLVPVSEADNKKRLELLQASSLPKFAKRCGKECTDAWNKTVGPVLGVKAVAK